MKTIPLSGKYSHLCALVDDEDYDRLRLFHWCGWWHKYMGKVYARAFLTIGGNSRAILMHRLILGALASPMVVDHKDHDGLNNQRSNLRLVTNHQNLLNSRKLKPSSSKYKGVTWDKQSQRWKARIYCNRVCYTLGLFRNEDEAGQAYLKAAVQYFGEFANLSEPSVGVV